LLRTSLSASLSGIRQPPLLCSKRVSRFHFPRYSADQVFALPMDVSNPFPNILNMFQHIKLQNNGKLLPPPANHIPNGLPPPEFQKRNFAKNMVQFWRPRMHGL
jgi:hypothetical protein